MNRNRFTLAVHVLTLMAIEHKPEPMPSAYYARAASTNAVVVRRVFSQLHKAGLITATPGARGGAQLARRPDEITLLDVYRATGEEPLFAIGSCSRNPHCITARHIGPVMTAVYDKARDALAQSFAGVTLAALAEEIKARDARLPSPPTPPTLAQAGRQKTLGARTSRS